MGKIAVFASGTGSNFEVLAKTFLSTPHSLCCLICDKSGAPVIDKATKYGIPHFLAEYSGQKREEAERGILKHLDSFKPDLLVLAGYMRLLSSYFISFYENRIINIHPALLPKHPGTEGLKDSYKSADKELGITIHYVDEGMDTGPIIYQHSFQRRGDEKLEEIEERIHSLEHTYFPGIILELLEKKHKKQET